jgi:hypothetical protein
MLFILIIKDPLAIMYITSSGFYTWLMIISTILTIHDVRLILDQSSAEMLIASSSKHEYKRLLWALTVVKYPIQLCSLFCIFRLSSDFIVILSDGSQT